MEKENLNLTYVENEELEDTTPRDVNARAKELVRLCEENGIPIFMAYYLANKGYKYRAVLPEELDNPDVSSEYGKFAAFLRIVMDFNKADYITNIK